MMTQAAVRQSQPATATTVIVWPRAGLVVGTDGTPVSSVVVAGPPRHGKLTFDTVDSPSAMLTHHFGRGGQRVGLYFDDDDHYVEGWLTTNWECGHREWWLEVDGARD